MISEDSLRLAVARGILSHEQAEGLRALAREQMAREFEPVPDHEKLRFISGFGDIFVVIGIGLFLGASGYFLAEHAGVIALWTGLVALSWGLAELFTRRRRMALPSIVLLVLFSAFSFGMLNAGLSELWGPALAGGVVRSDLGIDIDRPGIVALAALLTCPLVGLHYWRFRVPITIAAGIAALALSAFAFLSALAPAFMLRSGGWVILLFGCGVFWLAMRFDQADLRRETRRTDIAFWLHLLAAPMLVHSFISVVFGGVSEVTMAKALGLILLFLVLALLALLIDRRAILVSALAYAGIAFGTLFRETALTNATVPASLLVLGAFILGLSSGWQPLRRAALGLAPPALRARLPVAASIANP